MRTLLRVGAVGLAGLVAAACTSSPSSHTTTTSKAAPTVVLGYVTTIGAGANSGTGSDVAVVPLDPAGAVGHVAVGTFPAAIAISDGTAYVANYASNTITPIDLATGHAGKAIPAGDGPAGVAITPDGKTAYVTDAGSSPLGTTVTPINLVTRHPESPITVGAGPEGIAITPDGSMAYVANSGAIVSGQSGAFGHTVTPIDLATRKAMAPINVGNAPVAVAISPDGSTAFVANLNSGSVTPITIATNSAGPGIAVAGAPQALAVSSSYVYVASDHSNVAAGNNVVAISLASDKAGAPLTVGATPTSLAIEGSTAYVVCSTADGVELLHLAGAKMTPGRTIHVAGGPYAIALAVLPRNELTIPGLTHPAKRTHHS